MVLKIFGFILGYISLFVGFFLFFSSVLLFCFHTYVPKSSSTIPLFLTYLPHGVSLKYLEQRQYSGSAECKDSVASLFNHQYNILKNGIPYNLYLNLIIPPVPTPHCNYQIVTILFKLQSANKTLFSTTRSTTFPCISFIHRWISIIKNLAYTDSFESYKLLMPLAERVIMTSTEFDITSRIELISSFTFGIISSSLIIETESTGLSYFLQKHYVIASMVYVGLATSTFVILFLTTTYYFLKDIKIAVIKFYDYITTWIITVYRKAWEIINAVYIRCIEVLLPQFILRQFPERSIIKRNNRRTRSLDRLHFD